jgi:hypothetical protein
MKCRWLEAVFLNHPGAGLDLNSRLQPPSKVDLDIVRGNLTDRSVAEHLLEMPTGTLVGLMGLFCAHGGLGVVLQEKVHPIRKL